MCFTGLNVHDGSPRNHEHNERIFALRNTAFFPRLRSPPHPQPLALRPTSRFFSLGLISWPLRLSESLPSVFSPLCVLSEGCNSQKFLTNASPGEASPTALGFICRVPFSREGAGFKERPGWERHTPTPRGGLAPSQPHPPLPSFSLWPRRCGRRSYGAWQSLAGPAHLSSVCNRQDQRHPNFIRTPVSLDLCARSIARRQPGAGGGLRRWEPCRATWRDNHRKTI